MCGCRGKDLLKVPAPKNLPDQHHGGQQTDIPDPADDEFFPRSEHGTRPLRIEGEKLVQAQTGGHPRQPEQEQVRGNHEHADGAEGQQQPA